MVMEETFGLRTGGALDLSYLDDLSIAIVYFLYG